MGLQHINWLFIHESSGVAAWPASNNWGSVRREALDRHISKYLTLYPEDRTCSLWIEIVNQCRRAGKPIQTADAWIASAAMQWNRPLVTTDFSD